MIERMEFNISADSIDSDLYEDVNRFIDKHIQLINKSINMNYETVYATEVHVELDTFDEDVNKIEIKGYCIGDDEEKISVNISIK